MKVLVCDDEQPFLNNLTDQIREYMNTRFYSADITATLDPVSVIQSNEKYDIAFLDIQMDLVDGISLGAKLKERNPHLVLFFVTNYDEYIDSAMDLNAFRFFHKPFDVSRLHSGLDKAMEYLEKSYVHVFVKSGAADELILIDSILYVTRENRRVIICTQNGDFETAETFDAFCEKIVSPFFYLVHKSFYVNLHHVSKYSYSELYISNGTRIAVAPRKQAAFHKFWFGYLRRH